MNELEQQPSPEPVVPPSEPEPASLVIEPEAVSKRTSPPKEDLLKARMALAQVELLFGDVVAAKRMLADKIKDGKIKAYARYHWTTTSKKIRQTWTDGPGENVEKRVRVKPGVLSGASKFDDDVRRWKWRKGDFYVTHHKAGGKVLRHFYRDVRFDKRQILDLISDKKMASRAVGKGGRGFAENQWANLWFEVIRASENGTLKKTNYSSSQDFCNKIYTAYEKAYQDGKYGSEKCHKFETVKDQLNRAYENFIDKPEAPNS